MTRRVRLIGIGTGHPDQVTVEAVQALRSCDAFLVPDKADGAEAATEELVRAREGVLHRHVGAGARLVTFDDPPRDRQPHTDASYQQAVDDWHDARAAAFGAAITATVPEGGTVGLLVWGDPAFYDSTIRVLDRIVATGADVTYDVVPGIGAVSVLAARHRLVLNTVGSSVTVTTGRRLLDEVAAGRDNLVVMLDGSLTCSHLDGAAWDIWWGANLGTCRGVAAGRTAGRRARGHRVGPGRGQGRPRLGDGHLPASPG